MSGTFAGERAVVIGCGVSGRAAASVLLAEGAGVRITEARSREEILGGLEEADALDGRIELLAGGHQPDHLDGATLVVASPGVPEGAPVMWWVRERGLRLWSELELGARLCRVPYVAVTGTNGKTTTTEMVAAVMRADGLSARSCGNVGFPFSMAAREGSADALAVEASSFQLRFQETLHPRVSVLLNLAPDHLDWHGSLDAYASAKARVYANQSGHDVHVGNRDDPAAARVSAAAPCEVRWFGGGHPHAHDIREVGVSDGAVVAGPQELARPPSGGGAFLADAAAAAAAARAFGLSDRAIRIGLGSFAPLPHRGTVVSEVGSVRFVDDSKATNPHAALAALEGLSDAVLIAGGVAKGVDLSPLASAAPSLAGVVAIGEASSAIVAIFEGLTPVVRAGSMKDAVDLAARMVPSGGTVILAPACASQDMFRDYRDRGEQFAVAARSIGARLAERRQGRASHA